MLTAIVVLLSVEVFLRVSSLGAIANVKAILTQIEMNTRGYGK